MYNSLSLQSFRVFFSIIVEELNLTEMLGFLLLALLLFLYSFCTLDLQRGHGRIGAEEILLQENGSYARRSYSEIVELQ